MMNRERLKEVLEWAKVYVRDYGDGSDYDQGLIDALQEVKEDVEADDMSVSAITSRMLKRQDMIVRLHEDISKLNEAQVIDRRALVEAEFPGCPEFVYQQIAEFCPQYNIFNLKSKSDLVNKVGLLPKE